MEYFLWNLWNITSGSERENGYADLEKNKRLAFLLHGILSAMQHDFCSKDSILIRKGICAAAFL